MRRLGRIHSHLNKACQQLAHWSVLRLDRLLLVMLLAALPARAGVKYTNIFSFNGTNGSDPGGVLSLASDGSLYGTTSEGGTNGGYGTIFRMMLDGTVTSLISFSGTNGAYLGTSPSSLIQGLDGNFYGTTFSGGTNGGAGGFGTVFQMSSNGILSTIISFSGTNGPYLGANPSSLIQGADGSFYGAAHSGGSTNIYDNYGNGYGNGYGTLFQMTSNGVFHTLLLFTGTTGPHLGRQPSGGLLQGADGILYGTTEAGGTNGDNGTVFGITTNGAPVWSFSFANTNGADPQAGLMQGSNGYLYGTTSTFSRTSTGSAVGSMLFRISTNGILNTLNEFYGPNGFNPVASLAQGNDGNFYGTTLQGGAGFNGSLGSGNGTVFLVTPSGALTSLYSFSGGANGWFPFAGLLQATDGNFYGMASSGGEFANGTIFRLSIPMQPVVQSANQADGSLTLTWISVVGQTYQLQYNSELTSSNWINFGGAVSATNGKMSMSDSPGTVMQRFYRVMLLP